MLPPAKMAQLQQFYVTMQLDSARCSAAQGASRCAPLKTRTLGSGLGV